MNLKKVVYAVLLVLCVAGIFALGAWVGANKFASHAAQPSTVNFSLFWDTYDKLKQNFIDPSKIVDQKVVYGAIEGMTRSLGDPYTDFFNPDQAQRFQQDLAGSFDGIGVEVAVKKGLLTIIAPLKGTPGQKAGLKSGDTIAKINGKETANISADEAVSLIRGKKGSTVTLAILRDSWTKTQDFKITRDTIKVPTVDMTIKNGDVAYVQIYQFDESLTSEFGAVALKILQSPAKKIVLDLRDNPGGYLTVAQDIAGFFMDRSQIVTIEDFGKNKSQQIYKTEGNSSLANYPIVVLINQGSASASEILAGALRDNRNVQLVGMKSFGKGCVQEVINLDGGSFLKVTIANWLTPKGGSISDVGLTPNVKVDITDQDILGGKDPQLSKALEIVKGLK